MMRNLTSRFLRNEDGTALIEFGLLLPTLLLFLGLTVEGARTFWSYQTTITGVRDATRFLSRVVPVDICTNGGSTTAWDEKLADIVRNAQDGERVLPKAVSVTSVTSTLTCNAGSYRNGSAPVATITAALEIDYPFSGLFSMVGGSLESVSTSVSDSTRLLGL